MTTPTDRGDGEFVPQPIIDRARALLASGRGADARELLLLEGFVLRAAPALEEAYLTMIAPSSTLQAMQAEAYANLESADAKVRLRAATQIAKECAKVCPRDSVRWMRDPRATSPLLQVAIDDADSKVSERALKALACILCAYFPDQRALPVLVSRLSHPKQDMRLSAINGIACLRNEAALEHLVHLLRAGTETDRAAIFGAVSGLVQETIAHRDQRPLRWSDACKAFWVDQFMSALTDASAGVRRPAAAGLKHFCDRKAIPALQAARIVESDVNAAYFMDDAIACLQSGS